MLLYLSMLDTQEEKDKFTEIYDQYQHFCWYVANQLLEDAHLAEDAVQDAFLALTRHLDKVDDVDSPKTRKFLMTIVKSKAIDILRKRKGGELSTEDMEAETQDPARDILDQYITKENYNHLISCILELDEAYRVVFEYKYVHQLSDGEIAQLLNITPKLVNVRFFRARKKLQDMLEKEVVSRAGTR
ncbi:MAG: sigma-70 family RNA polymerase sigma factor [Lachnospiraceae bacterium]|jgi:RNA polymerase sigma-70 factor (ECF subfamily)|nr:sigma-70 family RNA polymerase sigma factor [Lachnospiraceae bacterium]